MSERDLDTALEGVAIVAVGAAEMGHSDGEILQAAGGYLARLGLITPEDLRAVAGKINVAGSDAGGSDAALRARGILEQFADHLENQAAAE
ncbi:hypothetical protein ABIE44_001034 [Marmoricola sp. OAE513]|uniref:hypothetical protein n=1 Tax=Marmoricola sp. OAE513 TaxID=2817894 RepID=UPI001AE94BAD